MIKKRRNAQGNVVRPELLYLAIDGLSTDIVDQNGATAPVTIGAGRRLRGDNPLVQKCPHLFALDGVDDAELARLKGALYTYADVIDTPDVRIVGAKSWADAAEEAEHFGPALGPVVGHHHG